MGTVVAALGIVLVSFQNCSNVRLNQLGSNSKPEIAGTGSFEVIRCYTSASGESVADVRFLLIFANYSEGNSRQCVAKSSETNLVGEAWQDCDAARFDFNVLTPNRSFSPSKKFWTPDAHVLTLEYQGLPFGRSYSMDFRAVDLNGKPGPQGNVSGVPNQITCPKIDPPPPPPPPSPEPPKISPRPSPPPPVDPSLYPPTADDQCLPGGATGALGGGVSCGCQNAGKFDSSCPSGIRCVKCVETNGLLYFFSGRIILGAVGVVPGCGVNPEPSAKYCCNPTDKSAQILGGPARAICMSCAPAGKPLYANNSYAYDSDKPCCPGVVLVRGKTPKNGYDRDGKPIWNHADVACVAPNYDRSLYTEFETLGDAFSSR